MENQQSVESSKQITAEDIKRIAEAVPMPAGTGHYQLKGQWDEGRQVYTVNEKVNIITEYKHVDKNQTGDVRQMRKESFRLYSGNNGEMKRKLVDFDHKTGVWKDRNFLTHIFSQFAELPLIMGTMVKDVTGEGKVLHTLEAHRPVNEKIMPVEVKTADELQIELALKQGHAEEMQRRMKVINEELKSRVDQANKEAWQRKLDNATKPPVVKPDRIY